MRIGHGTEADLGPIVEILNGVAATSIATFETHPTSVAERRAWFEQLAEAGLRQLVVARRDRHRDRLRREPTLP